MMVPGGGSTTTRGADNPKNAAMIFALAIFGVSFAAICIWLTVRIINRHERWAKWTLAMVLGVPVLYVASFGPACWLTSTSDVRLLPRTAS